MWKKIAVSSFFLLTIWSAWLLYMNAHATPSLREQTLPTYYSYSQEDEKQLEALSSEYILTEENLQQWDQLVEDYLESHEEIDKIDLLRVFTYLYTAQRDAAFFSYNIQGTFEGSLDPLNLSILQLFYPDMTPPQKYNSDPYSETLAKIVSTKFQERYREEKVLSPPFIGNKEKKEQYLQNVISKWIPWIIRPLHVFRPVHPPPPESSEWNRQIESLKAIQKNVTSKQKQLARYWSRDTTTTWRVIANEYMFEEDVPLAKVVLVRSVLMMGIADAAVANLIAKYHFNVPRPFDKDKGIQILTPQPITPSYPSATATIAKTAEEILTYYFPEDKKKWENLAQEASDSRLWAGAHYPLDIENGHKLGHELACDVIDCLQE